MSGTTQAGQQGSGQFVAKKRQKMLQKEVIEPANRNWACSNVFASTKDGSLRFHVHCGTFNSATVSELYPLQGIYEGIDALGESRILIVVDADSRYYKIKIDECSRAKAAFKNNHNLFQFVQKPIRLKTALTTLQRAIGVKLSSGNYQSSLVYLDGTVVFLKNSKNHMEDLRQVQALLQAVEVS